MPLDTKDFVPYLAQISADTEVLLPAFIGSLSVAFYTQAKNMGLDKKMKMISSSASIELIAPDDIQGAAEGVYFFENFPRMLKAKDDEFHKEFNKRMGIDDVHAREIGGQRVMDKSHGWQAWEDIFALKQAIENSGYKTRKDVEGVIQALEGMEMKNSLAHPQGDKIIRKEDHVGIIDCYISRVETASSRSRSGFRRKNSPRTCRCGTTFRRCPSKRQRRWRARSRATAILFHRRMTMIRLSKV